MLKINKIRPMFNRIVVKAVKYDDNVMMGSLIDGKKSNTIKEYQEVVAVGPSVTNIKVGDVVLINPTRYAVRKHKEGTMKDGIITDNPITQFNFNILEIAGEPHILLYDSDVDYVLESYEEIQDEKPALIKPKKPSIIV